MISTCHKSIPQIILYEDPSLTRKPRIMKLWVLKAIVQKVISYLPFAHKINFLFQKYITKGVHLSDEYFYDRLLHAQKHLKAYRKVTDKACPKTCLELGTGWYPVIPVFFLLAGAEDVFSMDISFLSSKKRIKSTLEKYIEAYENGKLSPFIKPDEARWKQLMECKSQMEAYELEEVLRRLHLFYKIRDARRIDLPNHSVDLIISNNTFEHIYPEILKPILVEFKRVLKPAGAQSHFIDLSDHFAHFDKAIGIYNFLKFSESMWKWIDNSIQPQSRLRWNDYLKLYEELEIPIVDQEIRKGNPMELKQLTLSPIYHDCPLEHLAISHGYIYSKA